MSNGRNSSWPGFEPGSLAFADLVRFVAAPSSVKSVVIGNRSASHLVGSHGTVVRVDAD